MRPTALLLASAVLLAAPGCQQDQDAVDPDCATPATVRNLTGLDGCGYVLELASGKKLEPAGPAWDGYRKRDGERVTIAYAPYNGASICMVGETVMLSCIQPAP